MKHFLFTLAIALTGAISVKAQTASATVSQTVTVLLKNSISINLTSGSGNNFTFDNTDSYSNGIVNANASTFQVKSNRPWAVTAKSATANFNGTASIMPSTVLGVRLNGQPDFAPLSTSATSLTSGSRGVASFNVDYKAAPGFSYEAGTYTISIIYTASQQ